MTFNVEQYSLGNRRLKDFVRVPWILFKGDPYWTPPLMGELLGSRLLGLAGLLTPEHQYHADGNAVAKVGRGPIWSQTHPDIARGHRALP